MKDYADELELLGRAEQDLLLADLLISESAAWEQMEQFSQSLGDEQQAILRHELTRRKYFYLQMLCKRAQLFRE